MALTTVRPQGMGFNTGRRNLIINGAMQVYQRGTTSTYQNNGGYDVDRFSYRRSGTISTTTFDVSQQDTTGLPEFPKCLEVKVQDAAMSDPNTPASARNCIQVNMEGQDLQLLQYATANAQPITVSFYVKSSVAGTYCWSVDVIDSLDSYIEEYTINAADTWEYKSFTVPAPTTSQVNTAVPNDTTAGFTINWTGYGNVTGTGDHRGVTGWQSYSSGFNKSYTANQTNAFTAVDNTFSLTGVQIEVGENASDFEHRSYGEELALCQRYYHRLDSANANGNYYRYNSQRNTGSTGTAGSYHMPVTMRSTPSISTTGTASNYAITHTGGNTACSSTPAIGGDGSGPELVNLEVNVASGLTSGQGSQLMSNNNKTSFIAFDAEI